MVVPRPPPCMASVSRWYRCIGLQNPCWQQINTQSQHEKAECKEEFHVWTFQTQGWPWERSYLVAVFFEKVSGSFQRRKSSLVRKFTLQKKKGTFQIQRLLFRLFDPTAEWDHEVSAWLSPMTSFFCHPKAVFVERIHNVCFLKQHPSLQWKSMEGHLTWALYNVILYLCGWRDLLWERFVSWAVGREKQIYIYIYIDIYFKSWTLMSLLKIHSSIAGDTHTIHSLSHTHSMCELWIIKHVCFEFLIPS